MSNQPAGGAPSFNRPEFVRFDSLRDSKDLGQITDIKAHLSGFIGAETGAQSLFFSFELLVPGTIQVQAVTDSKWTQRFVSVGLRSDTGSIGLDERGNARGVDIVNTVSPDESLVPFPPGKYTVVVSCSQWQTTPFGLILRVNPTTRLRVGLIGRGGLGMGRSRLRIAVAKLEGSLTGLGQLRAPGSGLFAGRRDKPLGGGFLTGRGGLTGTPSIRKPLRSLAGAFLTGRGGLGRATLTSDQLGPTMWVSRLATLTEMSTGAAPGVTLAEGDYSYQSFYFRPAGAVASQQRLAIVYRDPQGVELWMRITDIFVQTQDIGGWRLVPLPGGDALMYSATRGNFSTIYGLYVLRIRSDGTVAWKKQIEVAPPGSTGGGLVNTISHIRDATLHPGLGLVIFAITIGSHSPAYLYLNPVTGDYAGCRVLIGTQLVSSGAFGTQHESNGPLIKADGRMILTGARSVAPVYTWIIECDALCSSVSQFWKYTDGTSLAYPRGSCLHPDGSITMYGGNDEKLRLNPDFTIQGRTLTQGSSFGGPGFSERQFAVDSDGNVYSGGGFAPSILSMEQEGAVAYRGISVSGMSGRVDQTSARRPAKWFNIDTRYAVASPDAVNAASGLGCLMFGFDIDMAPTTVSGTGYSLTIGSTESVTNTIPLPLNSLVIQRYPDELGGTITAPIAFANAALVRDTSTPGWNPNFIDASTILTFERRTSTIRRGLNTTIPKLRIKENPAQEPDPYGSFVTFHLPGSGVADTNGFVDYGPFSLTPAQIQGGVRYSTAQARFPDIGGFFESTSIRFGGSSNDAIVYGSSPAFRIGRQDFTLEAWIYRLNGNFTLFDNALLGDPSSHTNSFALFIASDGRARLQTNNTGPDNAFNNAGVDYRRFVPLATWTHIAISREDTIWRIHINGVLDSSGRLLDTDLTAAGLLIGRACQPFGANYQLQTAGGNFSGEFITPVGFSGFLADIRFTLGIARYHRSFQPRSAPIQYIPAGPPQSLPAGTEPAESGPATVDLRFNSLLLFARMNGNDNVFRDSGPYDHSVIPFGNVTQVPGGKWGGSQAAFDAFGDWIEVPSNAQLALGTGDFTITLWATRTGEGQNPEFFQALLDTRTTEPEAQFCLRVNRVATGRQLCLYVGGAIRILGVPMVTGVRYHIAVVRRSGITTLYMNGNPVGAPWADATNYTSTNWTIGRARFADGADQWYFQGRLNDVRIERGAVYTGAFTPPTAPIGTPPAATARYWRLIDLRPYNNNSGNFAFSEIALHQGRNRIPNTPASSLPAPSGGLLTNTQDLETTLNCTWPRSTMEQVGSWIRLDAGEPVTVDGLRLATASQSSTGVSGLTLQYSEDDTNWTTLGHIAGIPITESTLSARLGAMPLPGAPEGYSDPAFDRVVLFVRGNEPGATVLDSSPRGHNVENFSVSKSTVESTQGGQSLLFSAGSNSYLTLGPTGGDTLRRSVFFSFGTGALTIEMDVFPLTVPPVNAVLYSTNPTNGVATHADGFMWVLTSQMKLDLFINNAFRGVSLASVQLGAWNRLRLSRDAAGAWRYTINGVVDDTTFTNAINISSRAFTIGRNGSSGASPWHYNGYMDEIVVTRGLARGNATRITNLAWTGLGRGRLTGTLAVSQTLRGATIGRGRLAATLAAVDVNVLQGTMRGQGRLIGALIATGVADLATPLRGAGALTASLVVVSVADLETILEGAGAIEAQLSAVNRRELGTLLTGSGGLGASLSTVASTSTFLTTLARDRLTTLAGDPLVTLQDA